MLKSTLFDWFQTFLQKKLKFANFENPRKATGLVAVLDARLPCLLIVNDIRPPYFVSPESHDEVKFNH